MKVADQRRFDFMVACCRKKHFFNLEEVVRLEASSNYTLIHTINTRPLVVAKVLSAYEELLEGLGFIRVHRSHLINMRFVAKLTRAGGIILQDDRSIQVSRRRRKEVMKMMGN